MPPFRPLRDRRASLDALQELRPNFHASVEHATIRAMELAMRRIGLFLYPAKHLLEQSRLRVEDIAREAGFGSRERMRRAFLRVYGEAPRSIRVHAGPRATN